MNADRRGNGRLWLVIAASAIFLLILLGMGFNHAPGRAPPPPPKHFESFNRPANEASSPAFSAPPTDIRDDVFNSTLGFQKVFVISLPYRSDRRDSMSLAASFSGFEVEYIDGVAISDEELPEIRKILPPGGFEKKLKAPGLGAWRAHLNAIRQIVEQNITSALILEDDVDWDLRIKSQLRDFATASNMLVQPMPGTTDQFLDPTYPSPSWGQRFTNFDLKDGVTTRPTTSPYGDINRWDVLWLGHCGSVFPTEDGQATPLGRVVISNDETVPEPQHIKIQATNKDLKNEYPAHTRVVSRARHNICTTTYAVSQLGARRLLWELGVNRQDSAMDVMLSHICDGTQDRRMAKCLTLQPPYFNHHRPVARLSTFSDISPWGDAVNKVAFTHNVRWSARLNFEKFAMGETDYIDSFPDGT